jgi:holin-like protein
MRQITEAAPISFASCGGVRRLLHPAAASQRASGWSVTTFQAPVTSPLSPSVAGVPSPHSRAQIAPSPWRPTRFFIRATRYGVCLCLSHILLISEAGYAFVGALRLPLPGNLAGMLMLCALLSTGVIHLEWVEAGASLLVRHLAFFFIPIAVGLMAFGDLFVRHGVAIIVTLIVSAGIGISQRIC